MGTGEYKAAFLIADLTGYTALTEAHGDFSTARRINRFSANVEKMLTENGNLPQQVGDEVFLISSNSRALRQYAIRLRDEIEKDPPFSSIYTGLRSGAAVKQAENIFGSAINLSYRIAGYTRAGQIICSQSFQKSQSESDFSCHFLGQKIIKNVLKPVEIFEIMTEDESNRSVNADPVCRKHISEDTAPA